MILNLVLPNSADELLPIEIEDNASVKDLSELAAGLTSESEVSLYFGMTALTSLEKTIASYGVGENDIIIVRKAAAPAASTQVDRARIESIANLIRQNLAPPRLDPDSAEGQNAILQAIQQANIQKNLMEAQMNIPESFVKVTMLYVELCVNNVPLQAFVDCGAQSSIMSKATAEKCNLNHLIDTRYSGIARGIGETKISGRIHRTVIEAGGAEFDASFIVVEKSPLLFGLDLLYRHRCCIDLKNRCLRIADVVVLPFLDEAQIDRSTTLEGN